MPWGSALGRGEGNSGFTCAECFAADMRQDMLTLQILRVIDKVWQDNGMDLRYARLPL